MGGASGSGECHDPYPQLIFPFNRGLLGPNWVYQGSARSGTTAVSAPLMLIPSPKKWPSTTRCRFLGGGLGRGLTGRWQMYINLSEIPLLDVTGNSLTYRSTVTYEIQLCVKEFAIVSSHSYAGFAFIQQSMNLLPRSLRQGRNFNMQCIYNNPSASLPEILLFFEAFGVSILNRD